MKRMLYALDCDQPTRSLVAGPPVLLKMMLVAKCVQYQFARQRGRSMCVL